MRLVKERLKQDPALPITAVLADTAVKLGTSKETLWWWHCQDLVDTGCKAGITSEENAEIRRLRKENLELRQTNEIVKLASAFSPPNSTPAPRNDRGY